MTGLTVFDDVRLNNVISGHTIIEDELRLPLFPSTPSGTPYTQQGDLIYNETGNILYYFNGEAWVPLGSGSVSSVTAGTGLNVGAGPGGTITTTGTLNIATTGVTAGSYTNTNLTVNAEGQITAASSGTGTLGYAEYVYTTQAPNNSVAPYTGGAPTAFTFGNVPVVSTLGGVVATTIAGPGQGTEFTISTPGTYVLDYEMSLGSAGSIGVYTGAAIGALALDTNSSAGSTTATSWIHGRAIEVVASTLIFVVSSIVGTAAVVTAGTDAGSYMCRLTVLKIA
jgi:hypothetical protein